MAELSAYEIIQKLKRGEKVLCDVCKKSYYDNSTPDRAFSNYFHCENPDCRGYVHIQKALDIE